MTRKECFTADGLVASQVKTMESGTLDFEDLMDTGDFPGFEIAKFTPANADKENDGDGILRTPEHHREDDDNEFVLQKNVKVNKIIAENGDCGSDGEKEEANHVTDEPLKDEELNDSIPTQQNHEGESSDQTASDDVKEEEEEPVNSVDNNISRADEETPDYIVSINADYEEDEQDEPIQKKKKMSLLPASKPKMKLWAGNQKPEKVNSDIDSKVDDKVEENDAGSADETKVVSPPVKNGKTENVDDENNPHQQSFLSFLNLQPGNSKPQNDDKNKQEKTKTEDFYSRKRLRTRKKVSYCEDVAEDLDEEYKDDDEEDPYDHEISFPRRRRSSAGSQKQTAANNVAVAKYAEALKKLSGQPKAMVSSFPKVPNTGTGAQTITSTVMYRNILLNVSQNQGKDGSDGNSPMKGLFECGLCGTFFNTAGQFINHQQNAHGTDTKKGRSGMETFRCELCQFVLTNRFAYMEHKRMKHSKNQVTFNCSKCGSTFGYLIDLQKHKQICGLPFTYNCTHCNLQMRDMQELKTHNAKFHSQNTTTDTLASKRQWVSCAVRHCTFKCLTQMEMKHHVQNKHNVQNKNNATELFPCNAPRCSKIFSTREKLMEHKQEVHASEFIVQYQCMECKKCYSTKALLAEHQYLHLMDRMRRCDLCMRQFNSLNQLMKHKEVHVVKRTYRCTACSRWCHDRQELALHVCREKKAKLVGLRIYFCDVCHQDFKSDEQMFRHREKHKKYYMCGTCRWEGNDEEEYYQHRETHGLYTCRECCEEIPTENEMATHSQAHKFYVKMEELEEEDGDMTSVMYLHPNLVNTVTT